METEAALKKQGHKMANIILPFCSICTPDDNWFKKKLWRRGSESNRRPRLCRPLHNHSATPPLTYEPNEKRESLLASPTSWSGKRGSNSRPQPWQGCALPLSYSRAVNPAIISDGNSLSSDYPADWRLTSSGMAMRK